MHVIFFDCDNDLLLFKVPVDEKKPIPEAPKPTVTPQKVSPPQGTDLDSMSSVFFFLSLFCACRYNMRSGG